VDVRTINSTVLGRVAAAVKNLLAPMEPGGDDATSH